MDTKKRFDFCDLYFTIVFTALGLTFLDVDAITIRIAGLVAVVAFIPLVMLYDAVGDWAAKQYEKRHSEIHSHSDWR